MGHRISEGGIETDDSKIKVICKWLTPRTDGSFLGFTNYYHRFIYKYAHGALPLYQFIVGEKHI